MSRKRKFVYTPDELDAPNNEPENSVEQRNSSSESEESGSDGDLEKDLLQFDQEQAELIRSVNKMGSMRLSSTEYSQLVSPNNSHMSAQTGNLSAM